MSKRQPLGKDSEQHAGGDGAPAESDVDLGRLAAIRKHWPAVGDVQRRAFARQHTDAQCDALGARTRARLVRREAYNWVIRIDEALREHGAAIRYSPVRFAWFLDCFSTLETTLSSEQAAATTSDAAKAGFEQAEAAARATYDELKEVCKEIAGEMAIPQSELDAAIGIGKAADELEAGVRSLAALASRWLGTNDPEFRALVEVHQLGPADVAEAVAAADALRKSFDATRGGALRPMNDSPATNRAEGRVLVEMRVAMYAFGRAHRANKLIPVLSPGRGTRHVLAPSRKEAPAEPAPATSQAAAAAGGESATATQAAAPPK